jgi:hypothetical protein
VRHQQEEKAGIIWSFLAENGRKWHEKARKIVRMFLQITDIEQVAKFKVSQPEKGSFCLTDSGQCSPDPA